MQYYTSNTFSLILEIIVNLTYLYLDISETEIEKSVGLAEKYLIQVLYRNNLSTTFDDLKY